MLCWRYENFSTVRQLLLCLPDAYGLLFDINKNNKKFIFGAKKDN